MRATVALGVLLLVAAGLAACSGGGGPPVDATAWVALPDPPLSPRAGATGVWTGTEALVLGGSDDRPCPPSAACATPTKAALRDGAAFDPGTRTWRPIADAPVPITYATAAVIGRVVYLWALEQATVGQMRLLAYDLDHDRWETLPPPKSGVDSQAYGIAATDDALVAFASWNERGELPDLILDPATGRWEPLPDDPLAPSPGRSVLWDGRELVLFALPAYGDVAPDEPSLVRAAALDLGTRTWRRLQDTAQLGFPITAADGLLVNPDLNGADGGEVNGWGRRYPFGGILDARAGRWLPLPDPPERGEFVQTAGILWSNGAAFMSDHGWALDLTTGTWLDVPAYDETLRTQQTVVAAGRALLVFGGARWSSETPFDGELIGSARLWEPPAPAVG